MVVDTPPTLSYSLSDGLSPARFHPAHSMGIPPDTFNGHSTQHVPWAFHPARSMGIPPSTFHGHSTQHVPWAFHPARSMGIPPSTIRGHSTQHVSVGIPPSTFHGHSTQHVPWAFYPARSMDIPPDTFHPARSMGTPTSMFHPTHSTGIPPTGIPLRDGHTTCGRQELARTDCHGHFTNWPAVIDMYTSPRLTDTPPLALHQSSQGRPTYFSVGVIQLGHSNTSNPPATSTV